MMRSIKVLGVLSFFVVTAHGFVVRPASRLSINVIGKKAPCRDGVLYSQSPLSQENVDKAKANVNEAVDLVKEYGNKLTTVEIDKVQDGGRQVLDTAIKDLDLQDKNLLWAFPPLIIFLLILGGHIPLIGGLADLLAGPGLMLIGLFFLIGGIAELGSSLSPYPKPSANNNSLKTTGVYTKVRHPMDGGLLMFSLGFATSTQSFERVLLTALLWWAIEQKVEHEEFLLTQTFPEYPLRMPKEKYFPFLY